MAAITRRGQAPTLADPAGTGPFRLARLDRTRRVISLTAFADHALGRPYVDTNPSALAGHPDGARAANFSAAIDNAAHEQLIAAVAREAHVRALGAALTRTSRQLHTLEQRVAPELAATVAAVDRALEERDREEHIRLRHLRQHRR
mgnify:CR=1 FL=1